MTPTLRRALIVALYVALLLGWNFFCASFHSSARELSQRRLLRFDRGFRPADHAASHGHGGRFFGFTGTGGHGTPVDGAAPHPTAAAIVAAPTAAAAAAAAAAATTTTTATASATTTAAATALTTTTATATTTAAATTPTTTTATATSTITASSTICPASRRPYHTLLTAQATVYQQWQARIMYYHWKKQSVASGPCGDATGFTRLVASENGAADGLEGEIPSVFMVQMTTAELAKHGNFGVLNRPVSVQSWIDRGGLESVEEEYIYIAETDHVLTKPLPNFANGETAAAFPFHYMHASQAHQQLIERFAKGKNINLPPLTSPTPTPPPTP